MPRPATSPPSPRPAGNGRPATGAERVPHRCLLKLKAIQHVLKRAERRAADFLLKHPEEVAELGVVEFAERAGCSEATAVRLARKLGYEGFPEMRRDFADFEPLPTYRDITPADAPEVVARKVFANSIQALTDTLGALDWAAYQRAVEALCAAPRLAFFGLGNAGVVARETYHKFLRLGVPCFTAEDPDLQLIIVNTQLERGDVLTAISYTGESTPLLAAVRQARARRITVLGLTNFPRSTLARLADVVLLTAVFQEHVNGEIGSKRLAQLAVLESLYVNYLVRAGHRFRRGLARVNQALGVNKLRTPFPKNSNANTSP